jgi:hypothetical protein
VLSEVNATVPVGFVGWALVSVTTTLQVVVVSAKSVEGVHVTDEVVASAGGKPTVSVVMPVLTACVVSGE